MDNNSNKVVDTLEKEENVDVEVETSDDQPGANTNTTNNNIPSGLQQIEDDNINNSLPMGMTEAISNAAEGRVEVEQIDDNDGPEPPVAMLEESLNATDPQIASKTSTTISNNLASVNEQSSPPTPFDSAEYEDDKDTIAKKKAKDEMNQQKPAAVSNNNEVEGEEVLTPSDRDSIYEPSREHIESMDEIRGITNTNTGRGDTNRRGWEDIESSVARQDIESQTRTDNNEDTAGNINNDSLVDADTQANVVPASTNQEGLPEIEAYLVEDGGGEVYDATPLEPTLPWWKQRRTKILLGVVLVIVGTFAIALGVTLSQSNKTIFVTPPTFSIAPSSSIAPSTSPSTTTYECFDADDGDYNEILYNAVRAYVDQLCANYKVCPIAQTYGWPMNSWCVDNVKDMSYLFSEMDTFNENINGWNTSSVTDMSGMFEGASSFNGDLSNFNTSRVTNMSYMFYYAKLFNGDVSNFDTSRVTDMGSMFKDASSFNQDLSNFDTSRVTSMGDMFSGAKSFSGRGVSNFDTSRVTDMEYMFYGASSFNQDVSNFDISSVTNMYGMFWEATSFNQNLCSWQDTFPYTNADDSFLVLDSFPFTQGGSIFTDSNCTYQDAPSESQKGPFCASDCQ